MPSAVTCLGFILLFTIIFIITSLFFAFIYVTGRYIYDRLYPETRRTANDDEGVTKSHKGFIDRPTLHDGLSDRGHHTLQNQRQHSFHTLPYKGIQHVTTQGSGGTLLNTQNASTQHGIPVGVKIPPNPHVDRSAQSLRGPWMSTSNSTFDSHVHATPNPQRLSPVPAAVDEAQGYKAYSVLTITMRYSKIRNKDVHIRYFTSSSASRIRSPPSQTPCWIFDPEDLYLHWQGPSNVKVWIWERNGNGETGGAWRPIQAGYSHPRLPEHQFHVLKSARPTWIMMSTWQKRYWPGERAQLMNRKSSRHQIHTSS
ncbi:uncharacterized protein LACBIDRAFT_328172 [Laccaria bicolor S238N-H82]|uniref:Predicted protein n=1 Tax=Laccaria bicolor (strain S238N-H82 / ATCC MYA-4686) TaxID=486041 RepID=B0DDZ2_LACBS|nr:uncharacterized protein LACBIDRAFT_328172 [Laccaria bicolor S238N-H82]EDR07172.1 predicted protein [Laccaria bicolor S238N-H82]|eukprot:XP_001882103.1 predicted protein [Laccaria bicolor S238N-H82]